MKRYGQIVGDGLVVVVAPILVIVCAVLLVASVPFFLIGLIKRGVVAAFTAGDPLVP